ncbi:MAG: MFS transporter, partial [Rhodospirillales bacterium]|nr:MFS transporter [Rhodospirillales bacterium]
MADGPSEQFSWKLQGVVYGTAFFNGTVHSMASLVVALLVAGLVSTTSPFLIALILASRQILTVTMSIYGGALMDRYGTRRVVIMFGLSGVVTALVYPVLPVAFGLDPASTTLTAPGWAFVSAIVLLQMVSGYAEGTIWIGSQALTALLLKGHPVYAGRMTFVARSGGILGLPAVGAAWDLWGAWGGFGMLSLWILCGVIAALFLPKTGSDAAQSGKNQVQPAAPEQTMPVASDYAKTFRMLLIPAVAMVIMLTVMRQTGSGMQGSFYVVWLDKEIGLSGTLIGALLSAASATSAVSALMTGPMARRFTTHWSLIFAIGLSIIGISITPMLGDFYVLLIIAICARGQQKLQSTVDELCSVAPMAWG